jgi:nitroimidazol reductase NimA-like FMN-containing flavoprotein (pyridoxamine 5'-phosphate oxidase superfamily)
VGIALSRDEQLELLGQGGSAVLATATADGTPVPLPVWYVTVSGQIYVRTPATAKRLRHIARNPTVAFLVDAGHAWRELRGVLITATARLVSDTDTVEAVQLAMAEQFADRLPPELPDRVSTHYADMVVLHLSPQRDPVSWDNRKLRL